jgi:WD40 repeat protein
MDLVDQADPFTRAVEVTVQLEDGSRRAGSGYRVLTALVLTASAVVVDAATVTLRYQADDGPPRVTEGRVVWDDGGVAMISMSSYPASDMLPPALFGRLATGDREVSCSILRFPRAAPLDSDDGVGVEYRNHPAVFGRIELNGADRPEPGLSIAVTASTYGDAGHSPLEAVDGAAVIVQGAVVGVVLPHSYSERFGVLTAIEIAGWLTVTTVAEPWRLAGFPDVPEKLVEVGSFAGTVVGQRAGAANRYDVFLSHSVADREAVRSITRELNSRGLRTYFDRWDLPRGALIQRSIEQALAASEAVVVLVGPTGFGRWHETETWIALWRAITSQGRPHVIPVLLPGASMESLPDTLRIRSTVDLRAGLDNPAEIEALVAGIRGQAPVSPRRELPDKPAPYVSLRAFTPAEAHLFHGRSAEVKQLIDRVRRSPFTAVVGASGSGKSSLVMAGLVPVLSDDWLVRRMVPGRGPAQALADLLASLLLDAGVPSTADPEEADGLGKLLSTAQATRPANKGLLLVIDQFEEVCTVGQLTSGIRPDAEGFVSAVCRAAQTASYALRIVVTLRADYLQPCLQHAGLRTLLENNQLLLGPPDKASIRRAIEQPADAVGAVFETRLVDRILTDMQGHYGALALLQTALAELWQRRRGEYLTHSAYDAIQGIAGALNQVAEDLYTDLPPAQQELTRMIFLRLVAVGHGAGHTRRRAFRHELEIINHSKADVDQVIHTLSRADVRLIFVEESTVELAHEALIDGWGRLRSWLRQNENDLLTHRQLTDDAQRWSDQHRDDSYLYRGARLIGASDWADRHHNEMSRLEQEFLTASGDLAASARAREHADRALARAGQAIFELERSPENALRLAHTAACDKDSADTPLVQRVMYRVIEVAAIRRVLRGHRDRLSSVAWHPSGKLLATGSYDGTVRLWDVQHARTLAVLSGHRDAVTCVAFDSTGRRLASGSWDSTAKVWDIENRREVGTLSGHEYWVSSVAWSPTDRYLATGSRDNTCRVWDVRAGAVVCHLVGHQDWVRSAEWHPGEELILTGSYDGTAGLWSFPQAERLATLDGHDDAVPAVAWSPDGTEALTASEDGSIQLWDMQERRSIRRIQVHTNPIFCVAWARTGREAVTGSEDGTLRVVALDAGAPDRVFPGHTGWVSGVAWSPDGTMVASSSADRTARLTSTRAGVLPTVVGQHTGWVLAATWHPDGLLAATAGSDGAVKVWDTAAGTQIEQLAIPRVVAAAWSPKGRWIATGTEAGTLTIWDARSWTTLFTADAHTDRISAVAWSPDERRLATSGHDGIVKIWDADSHEVKLDIQYDAMVSDVAWGPAGDRVVTAPWQHQADIWPLDGGDRPLQTLRGHTAPLLATDWNATGRHILTASGDATVGIWDAATGRQVRVLAAGECQTAAFSPTPTEQHVVTGGRDGALRLWNPVVGPDLLVTFPHPGAVSVATWRPDGRLVLTGCQDGQVRLWPASPTSMLEELAVRVRTLFPDDGEASGDHRERPGSYR